MPERYYNESNSYPYAVRSILQRVILYFKDVLYAQDTDEIAMKRFILSDTSDDSAAIRRSIDIFKNNQGEFPFTAYNIGDDTISDVKTHLQKSGNYYSPHFNAYISYIPITLNFSFISFFTTPFDYWRANNLLSMDSASLTRLKVPVEINGIDTFFYITINSLPTEKGSLAWDIEQQFGVGKIYPLVHSVEVEGVFLVVDKGKDENKGTTTVTKIVYPVDDMILRLYNLENSEILSLNTLIDTRVSPDILKVNSTIPVNNSEDIEIDSSITITFNDGVNEDSFINNYSVVPYFEHQVDFDSFSKIVTIIPYESLKNNTEYNILINKELKSVNSQTMENDFLLTFKTKIKNSR